MNSNSKQDAENTLKLVNNAVNGGVSDLAGKNIWASYICTEVTDEVFEQILAVVSDKLLVSNMVQFRAQAKQFRTEQQIVGRQISEYLNKCSP